MSSPSPPAPPSRSTRRPRAASPHPSATLSARSSRARSDMSTTNIQAATSAAHTQPSRSARSSNRYSVARTKLDDSPSDRDYRVKDALSAVLQSSSPGVSSRTSSAPPPRPGQAKKQRSHMEDIVPSTSRMRVRESVAAPPVANPSLRSSSKSKRESTVNTSTVHKNSRNSSVVPALPQRASRGYAQTASHQQERSPPTFLVQSPSISSPETLVRKIRRKPAPPSREPTPQPAIDALIEKAEERPERERRSRTKSGGKENEGKSVLSSSGGHHALPSPVTYAPPRDRLYEESPSFQRPTSPHYRVENWIERINNDRPSDNIDQTNLHGVGSTHALASPMQESTPKRTRTRSGTVVEPSPAPARATPLETPRRLPPPLPPRRSHTSPIVQTVLSPSVPSPGLPKSPLSSSFRPSRDRETSTQFVPPVELVEQPSYESNASNRHRTKSREVYIPAATAPPPTPKRERTKSSGYDVVPTTPSERRERTKSSDRSRQAQHTPADPLRDYMPDFGRDGLPADVSHLKSKDASRYSEYNVDYDGSTLMTASSPAANQRQRINLDDESSFNITNASPASPPQHTTRPPSRSSDKEGKRERTKTWSAGLALAQALGFGHHEAKDTGPSPSKRERTKSAAAELVRADSRPDVSAVAAGTPRSTRERTRSASGTPSRHSEPPIPDSSGKRARSKSSSNLQRTPSKADTVSDDTHVTIMGQAPDDEDGFERHTTGRRTPVGSRKSFYPEDLNEDEVARNRAEALAALSNSAPTTPRSSRHQSRKSRPVTGADEGLQKSDTKERLHGEDSHGRPGLGLDMRALDSFTLTAVESGSDRYAEIARPATSFEVRTPNHYSQLFEALSGPYTPPLHHLSNPRFEDEEHLEETTHSEYETEISVWDESADEDEREEKVIWAGPLANVEDPNDDRGALPKTPSSLAPPAIRTGLSSATSVSSLAWSGAEEVEEGFNAAASKLLSGMHEAEDEDEHVLSDIEEEQLTPTMPSAPALVARDSPPIDNQGGQQQRTWRSTLPSAAFSSLSDRYGTLEMHRQEIIWELTTTESSFVQSMRLIIQLFVQPLRVRAQPPTWIPGVPDEIARLFDWLDDIVQLHAEFASTLHSSRASQYPVVLRLASLLVPLIGRLEVHQPYLVRLEQVTRAIEKMLKEPDSDFGEFLRIQSGSKDLGRMSLSSWLLAPVQRLMKYPLFFKQLMKSTPRAHPDYLGTLFLYQSTDTSIRIMQEVKAREEEYHTVETLASRMSGLPQGYQLAVRGRRLLAQGPLVRVEIVESQRNSEDESDGRSSYSDGRKNSSYNPRFSTMLAESPRSGGSFLLQSRATLLSPISPISPQSLSPGSDFSRPSPRARPTSIRYTSNGKARESSVYAFVFTDVVVLASPVSDSHPLLRAARGGSKRPEWKVLSEIGLARVLSVDEQDPSIDYDYLLKVDLLPIPSDNRPILDFPSPMTISLTPPDPQPASPSVLPTPDALSRTRQTWKEAFRSSASFTLRALSFSINEPFSLPLEDTPSPVAPSIKSRMPRSPSAIAQQDTDATEAERGERAWWSHRYKLVAAEMQRGYSVSQAAVMDIPRAPETPGGHRQKAESGSGSGDYRRRLSAVIQGERLPLLLGGGGKAADGGGAGEKEDGKRGMMRLLSKRGR